jgi:hypothetical protein
VGKALAGRRIYFGENSTGIWRSKTQMFNFGNPATRHYRVIKSSLGHNAARGAERELFSLAKT